jgi:hypothetical protein
MAPPDVIDSFKSRSRFCPAAADPLPGSILSTTASVHGSSFHDCILSDIRPRFGNMPTPSILAELPKHTRKAVRVYWQTRLLQSEKQRKTGGSDQGLRGAVTGGAQMNGFVELVSKLVIEAGIDRSNIFYASSLELPGYFRPSKKWDFIVAVQGQLVAALELKSQVGPSFGNNFNNRTEEAMGSALDLWTAYREQAFGPAVRPWIRLYVSPRRLPAIHLASRR